MEALTKGEDMEFKHDPDDPPPVESWIGEWYGQFNRWAETLAGIARSWGFLP